jgi:hypothetical protein
MAPFKVNLASGLAVASYMIYRYPKTTWPVLKVNRDVFDHRS